MGENVLNDLSGSSAVTRSPQKEKGIQPKKRNNRIFPEASRKLCQHIALDF